MSNTIHVDTESNRTFSNQNADYDSHARGWNETGMSRERSG